MSVTLEQPGSSALHPIVAQMRPSAEQLPAVLGRGQDVAMTAGAGAGKTRTLVARYLSLLAEGIPLRSIVAITFTKKAAREMRNRVRDEVRRYQARPELAPDERRRWQTIYAELDGARINTIHALCSEVLRSHPAEAGLDPHFVGLEEGPAALLRGQVLDETLAWAADDPQAVALFDDIAEGDLAADLAVLLEKRLDAGPALAAPGDDPLAYWERLLGADATAGPGRSVLLPLDADQARRLPRLRAAFAFAAARYEELKAERDALDFDDLESRALALLADRPDVLARWQTEARAILVDEFQDTNSRQRDLVRLLNGDGAKLFIVGDAKQSIYRFRGADVSVFRKERQDIVDRGGAAARLDRSYRGHRALVEGINDLLRPVLGEHPDPLRPFVEPFAPLDYARAQPAPGFGAPAIELQLTVGTKSDGALDRAARALAARLRTMVESGQYSAFKDGQLKALAYDHIAVLCRAATGFSAYEDAFEAAGIPYVTVAGAGFYDRPEVRDLLNALRALVDPTDDLALTGLLRSPAFAVSDPGLYRLAAARPVRDQARDETPGRAVVVPSTIWDVLQAGGGALPGEDGPAAARAAQIIARLHALSGRVSVADLLKAFLDATDYEAALLRAGRTRAARNVAKLLSDAQTGELVSVGAFLDFVTDFRQTGTREGEARAMAEGAVQIMSVHQAKGLEFPIVVIGDAQYHRPSSDGMIIHPQLGVLLPPPRDARDGSAVYTRAKAWEEDQDEAESNRLLYVAATRAQELLIFSANVKLKKDGKPGWLAGWLRKLAAPEVLNLANLPLPHSATGSGANRLVLRVNDRTEVACVIFEPNYAAQAAPAAPVPPGTATTPLPPPLLAPVLPEPVRADSRTAEADRLPERRVWRVVPRAGRPRAPAWVVGSIVHEALAAWRFPDDAFAAWASARARSYGLADRDRLADAVRRSARLLARFAEDPLHAAMAAADRRLHEVPYSLAAGDRIESGVIDALFLAGTIWTIVEFKTDEIRDAADLEALLSLGDYRVQATRYAAAVEQLLGVRPRVVLCLLDCAGAVLVRPVDGAAPSLPDVAPA